MSSMLTEIKSLLVALGCSDSAVCADSFTDSNFTILLALQ